METKQQQMELEDRRASMLESPQRNCPHQHLILKGQKKRGGGAEKMLFYLLICK